MTAFDGLMAELSAEQAGSGTLGGVPLDAIYTPPAEGWIHLWRGETELATPWGARFAGAAVTAEALLRPWLLGARWLEIDVAAVEAAAEGAEPGDEPSDELVLALALFDGLSERLGHGAETARAALAVRVSTVDWRDRRETVQRGLAQVAASSELQIVLVPAGGLSLEEHVAVGTEIIGALRHPVELAIPVAALGAAELQRSGLDEPGLAAHQTTELRFEDAVSASRTLAEQAEHDGVRFGLRLDGSVPAPAASPDATGAEILPAVAELSRRLSDRLRARIPMSTALPNAAVQLTELAAAGLLPVITVHGDRAAPVPPLAALAEAVRAEGAESLEDFVCRRALLTESGKPFRQRVREHGEANGGVCLRDRQWVATWQAFDGAAAQPSVSERVRRALTTAEVAPGHAAELAAQIGSACRRVNRSRYADGLRKG